jgi:hypothetical protein
MADAGYSIEPGILSGSECSDVAAVVAATVKGGRAGARHLMSNAAVMALTNDRRLLTLAEKVLGSGATPYRATLFEKSGQANWLVPWHQDTALPLIDSFDAQGWGPWSRKAGILYAQAPEWALSRVVALRVHLDPSTPENGPLRVIPGSHLVGVLSAPEILGFVRAHTHTECLIDRGGVLVMRPLVIHSSSKARRTDLRRVLHIEYADSLELQSGIRLSLAYWSVLLACHHLCFGGYLSIAFFTMSSSFPTSCVGSLLSSIAMARQTSERVLGSRRSITRVPSV